MLYAIFFIVMVPTYIGSHPGGSPLLAKIAIPPYLGLLRSGVGGGILVGVAVGAGNGVAVAAGATVAAGAAGALGAGVGVGSAELQPNASTRAVTPMMLTRALSLPNDIIYLPEN
jgi:hypothetical protein